MSYVTPQKSCFWTIRSLFVSAKHLQKIFEKFMGPSRFIYTHLLIQVVFNTNRDLNNTCEFNNSTPPPSPFSAGGQPSIQNFKNGGGSGKKWVPGGSWRVSATDISLGEVLVFWSKKTFIKWNFQMSILACVSQTTNCLVLRHFGSVKPLE